MTDRDHLRSYVATGSNADFAALVSRHVGFVYGSALRQTRSHALAQEVSQAVFLELALHAKKLRADTQLGSWLCVVTRRVAVDVIRRESRLRRREQTAAELHAMNSDDPSWTQVEPVIDEALATLDEKDRRAVLLRFFDGRSLQEVGAALGLSDDAAQKRVSRALDRLRENLRRRGITTTAAALGTGLAASAQVAAPAGVAAGITASVPLAAGALGSGAAVGALSFLAMNFTQKALLGTAASLAIGGLIWEGVVIADQRRELAQLRAAAPEPHDTAARPRPHAGPVPPKSASQENPAKTAAGDPAQVGLGELAARIAKMREMLALAPEQQIPELERLTPNEWITVAMERDLQSADDFRRSLSSLRLKAKEKTHRQIVEAFRAYVEANAGELPRSLDVLVPRLSDPMAVAALARFEIVASGNLLQLDERKTILLQEKRDAVTDPEVESATTMRWRSTGYSPLSAREFVNRSERRSPAEAVSRALSAYLLANNNQPPPNRAALAPFFENPADAALVSTTKSPRISADQSALQSAVDEAAVSYERAHDGRPAPDAESLVPYFRNFADAARFQREWENLRRPKQ